MSYIPSKGLKERKSIKRNRMNSLQKKKKKEEIGQNFYKEDENV